MVDRHGPIGLVMNRDTTEESLDDLPTAIRSYVTDKDFMGYGETGPKQGIQRVGSIIRCTMWPHEWKKDTAVLQPWCIHAVPAEYARGVYDVGCKIRKSLSLTDEEKEIRQAGDHSVRCAPFSLAKAAARLCQYPEGLLAADPRCVADMINAIDNTRLSTTRGVFRSPLPINPKAYPLQFVPTNRNGKGITQWVMAHSDSANEGSAAREFARALELPRADTFAAISGSFGLPLYWLGSVNVTMMDLGRRLNERNLSQAVVKCCPSAPDGPHALVFACPGVGLAVLSTWPPVPDDLTAAPAAVLDCNGLLVNIRVRATYYTMETLGSFRHRWNFMPKPACA
jgi:hypothetical protein